MSSRIGLLLDPKLHRLIQLFLNDKEGLYHLQKISTESKVPLGTTFRLMKKLVDAELVETVPVGKLKLYRTNKEVAKDFAGLK